MNPGGVSYRRLARGLVALWWLATVTGALVVKAAITGEKL